jgi:hypothetical protein
MDFSYSDALRSYPFGEPMNCRDGWSDRPGFSCLYPSYFNKGYISKEEFGICERYYQFTRSILPPRLVIRSVIDSSILSQKDLYEQGRLLIRIFIQELFDIETLLAWVEKRNDNACLENFLLTRIFRSIKRNQLLVSRIMDLLFPVATFQSSCNM